MVVVGVVGVVGEVGVGKWLGLSLSGTHNGCAAEEERPHKITPVELQVAHVAEWCRQTRRALPLLPSAPRRLRSAAE